MDKIKVELLGVYGLEAAHRAVKKPYKNESADGRKLLHKVAKIMKHECYDVKTEVLTDNGWKLFKDLLYSDNICTLNPVDDSIEYQRPNKIISEDYSGKMYSVKGQNLDLLVTPNHKIYANRLTTIKGRKLNDFKLESAEDLNETNYCMKKTASKWVEGERFEKSFMRMVGFAIGDGFIRKGKNKKILYFHVKKTRKIEYIEQFLKDLKLSYEKKSGNNIKIDIGQLDSKHQKILLNIYDNNNEKQIPIKISSCKKESLECLLDGLLNSDGNTFNNHTCFSSTSKKLLDQIQILGLHIGLIIEKQPYIYNTNRGDKFKECRKLTVFKKHLRAEVNRKAKKTNFLGKSNWVDYSGVVYCVSVPKYNIIYVRRNGKGVWSGNSVLEHIIFQFEIDGSSRLELQEHMRHRMASPTVCSTRYAFKKLPEELKTVDTSKTRELENFLYKYTVFTDSMLKNKAAKKKDYDYLMRLEGRLNQIKLFCSLMKEYGADEAKYELPECFRTSFVKTINARSMLNFLKLRTSKNAHFEIRHIACLMKDLLCENEEIKRLINE
jgi:flavin-dependent thymidylate synthase